MRANGFAAVLLAVIAAGCADCGGGAGGEDAGVDAGLPPSELCRTLAERQCDFYTRCHADPASPLGFTLTDAGFNTVVPASERDRCVAALTSQPECEAVTASLETGRARLADALFRACIETAYPEDTCDRDAILAVQRCRDLAFLQGQVAAEGACVFDEDCVDAAYCTAASLDACGVCQPASSTTGTPCTRDAQCNPASHYCTGGDGEEGTCEPYKRVDDACTLSDPQQEECGPGNVCAVVGLGARCQPARQEGEACELNSFQCLRSGRFVFELVCAPVVPPSGGSAVDRCVRTQTVRGAACGNGEGASFGIAAPLCPESQYCLENLCVDRKAAGAACAETGECGFGLRCLTPPGGAQPTCEPYAGVDGACAADTDCQALLSCDTTTNTCQPRLSLQGEPCDARRRCADGACASGACEPRRAAGAGCETGGDCASSVCSVTCQDACWD